MKLVREHINEKFTKDSDPIKDMNIGFFRKMHFGSREKFHEWFSDPENLKAILKIQEFPEDILNDDTHVGEARYYIHPKYYLKLKNYVEKYISINSNYGQLFPEDFHIYLKKKYPHLKSWLADEGRIKESLNEKFVEDSDPVHDMGIGVKPKIVNWLNNHNIKSYTLNDDLSIDVNHTVNLSRKLGENLPEYIQFNQVLGTFFCDNNELTSLRGFPRYAHGVACYRNNLKTLKYAPKHIGPEGFSCRGNKLTSLKYLPKIIEGNLWCYDNYRIFLIEDVLKYSFVKGEIILK